MTESLTKQQSQGYCRKFWLLERTVRRESARVTPCLFRVGLAFITSLFGTQQAGPCSYFYFGCWRLNSWPYKCPAQAVLPMCTPSPKGPVAGGGGEAPSMFAYTIRRFRFSNWISLIWKVVLCTKTLQSNLALIVLGLEKKTRPILDTASLLSTLSPFLHRGSLNHHSEAETHIQQRRTVLSGTRGKPLYVCSTDGVLLWFELEMSASGLCLEHLVSCW